jgi:hypothetical protein
LDHEWGKLGFGQQTVDEVESRNDVHGPGQTEPRQCPQPEKDGRLLNTRSPERFLQDRQSGVI